MVSHIRKIYLSIKGKIQLVDHHPQSKGTSLRPCVKDIIDPEEKIGLQLSFDMNQFLYQWMSNFSTKKKITKP